ncbi:MAG: 50S ribosomal protein L4 [Bacteroidia bacterium]|nr:50S ribosomal protein L4 [Bacteroidia bacterium]
MELSVFNINGEDTGRKIMLNDSVFAIEPNDHAIYLDVKNYMANNRQGTHKTQERSDMSGSTKKIKRQKGTGTARAGSTKSPLFKGGARTFGPRPRDYSFKLNKKIKKIARKSALSNKAKQNEIIILEDFGFEAPKTKNITGLSKKLNIIINNILLVLNEQNKNIYLSSRNLQGFNVVSACNLDTYNILNASKLLLTESSLAIIEKNLSQ